MNTLTWIVIIGIIGVVAIKNWDKIQKLLRQRKEEETTTFTSELTQQDIQQFTDDKINYLQQERKRRVHEIDRLTFDLKQQIKEIDIEIHTLTRQPEEKKRKWSFRK